MKNDTTNKEKQTRGVLLTCFGKRGYYFAAYNFAFSIKFHNPEIKIAILHDGQLEKELSYGFMQDVFDHKIRIPEEILWHGGRIDPAFIKINSLQFSPFDITLHLDLEMQAFQDLNVIFDELEADGGYYYAHTFNTHTIDKGRDFPDMVWAWCDDIWNHFNLPNDAVLPATNSSFQYWKKSREASELHLQLLNNYAYPIPIDRLRYAWGGSQPDELYLNVALAQKGITGKTPRPYLFMGNSSTDVQQDAIAKTYPIMCFFGNQNQTRPFFVEWYDGNLIRWHKQKGIAHFLKYHLIRDDKHANKSIITKKNIEYVDDIITEMKHEEKINLVQSFFVDKEELRNIELMKVLKKNIECEEIEKIFLLSEGDVVLPSEIDRTKIEIIKTKERTTFQHCIDQANRVRVNDSTITIIANADIYFDDRNLRLIKELDFTETAFALSRWDIDQTGKPRHFNYEWSQDSWIFKGRIPVVDCDFVFGVPACDNRFACEIKKYFLRVANPSFTIKTYHLHNFSSARYSEADRLSGDVLSIYSEGVQAYHKKSILMIQKGKVGDVIACLPIAHELSKQYLIDWLLPKEYHDLIDRAPYVRAVTSGQKKYDRTLDLSFGQGGAPEAWWQKEKHRFDSFITAKYELSGISVDKRKDLSYNRDLKKEADLMLIIKDQTQGKPFILCHESSDYGDPINVDAGKKVKILFKPIDGFNIFDWRQVIIEADEIHCIDSSLCNFVEVIAEAKGIKKYYYKTSKVPEQYDQALLSNNWTTQKKDQLHETVHA